MPTPVNRAKIQLVRGSFANISASIGDLSDGELCYAKDQNRLYMVEGSTLTEVEASPEDIEGVIASIITAGTGIDVTHDNAADTVTIDLENTAVTPAQYGSGTAIPQITVDQQGRITAATTAAISTDMTVAADSGSNETISIGTDTFTIAGGTGLTSTATTDKVTIDLDDSGVTADTYGALAKIPAFTVDGQGRITAASETSLAIVNADVSATAEIAVSKLANGTSNQVLVTDGTDVSWSDDLIIAGDLTVSGTTTTIDTTTLLVEDKNIEIGNVSTPSDVTADGGGITLKGATDKTINWIDSTDAWTFSEHINIASAKEYRIAGTKVLDATSLGSGVTGSSLTSVGTIGTGVWNGTAIAAAYIGSDVTLQTITSNGSTTTTGLTIGGEVDVNDVTASGGGARFTTDGTLIARPADSRASTSSAIEVYSGGYAAGDRTTIIQKNGSASLVGQLDVGSSAHTSIGFTASNNNLNATTIYGRNHASAGAPVIYVTDSTGDMRARVNNNGSCVFSDNNFAIYSGGSISTKGGMNFGISVDADADNGSTATASINSNGSAAFGSGAAEISAAAGFKITSSSGAFNQINGDGFYQTTTGGTNSITLLANGSATFSGSITSSGSAVATVGNNQTFTKAQRGGIIALTDASTITPDFAAGNNFSLTIGGNRTLANPSNVTAGQSGVIVVTHSGGAHTLSYGSSYKFANGLTPALSSSSGDVDVLSYYVATTSFIIVSLLKDVS